MEKKKNKFLSNKVFVIFGILAILICLVAVFAPQICGDVDPTAGDLSQAIMAPSAAAARPSHTLPPKKTAKAPAASMLPPRTKLKGFLPDEILSTLARRSSGLNGAAQHSRESSLSFSMRKRSVPPLCIMRRVSVSGAPPSNSSVALR